MWFSKRRIYLDHASAPPVLPEAARAMHAEGLYGNPGAIHAEGVAAKRSLEDSRTRLASLLGVRSSEIVFTSGLTESNNLAIIGYARHLERTRRTLKGTHWIVSSIEHDSVLASFAEVERMGGTISYVEPDAGGSITPAALERVLRPETVFVSVGWANNEIGIVQPLGKLSRIIKGHGKKHGGGIIFHTDAGQAPLYLNTLAHSLGVDLLAIGANKLYGPHGISALYVASGTPLLPVLAGGGQEKGMRPGTESVALAAGFVAAFETVAQEREREAARLRTLRDELARGLTASVRGLVVNGDLTNALPHMLNVSIPKKPALAEHTGEYLALALDARGIAVSTKSACREGEASRSHVVEALGAEAWRAENTIRFSLGRDTSAADIRKVVAAIVAILE